MTSLEGHVTTPYKRGVAREYSSVQGATIEVGGTYDVVIPQVGNSAYCNRNQFREGGIVTFSFTNIILLLIVGFM